MTKRKTVVIRRRSNKTKRSIRTRFRRLVAVPSAVLLTLWLVGSVYTGLSAFAVWAVATAVQQADLPAVQSLTALQAERRDTMRAFSRPGESAALAAQRIRTDAALPALRAQLAYAASNAPQAIKDQAARFAGLLDQLQAHRGEVTAGASAKDEVFAYYNAVMDAGADLFETQARAVSDAVAGQQGITATELFRDADRMSRAASLGETALATGWTPGDHLTFAGLVGGYHTSLQASVPFAQPDVRSSYQQLAAAPEYDQLVSAENQLVEQPPTGRPAVAVTEQQWQTATGEVAGRLLGLATQEAADGAAHGVSYATTGLLQAALVDGVALLVIGTSVVLVWRHSRRLGNRLEDLRDESLDMAAQLPRLVERLRDGESVDVDTTTPQGRDSDEIEQVALAIRKFVHQALQATKGEWHARQGARKVFVGMGRRQAWLMKPLHRLISEAQHAEHDPAQLQRLYEADHLITRARRNTDNLLVLAGQRPGRHWTAPVNLYDLLAGAVGEIERYRRVDITHVPDNLALVGHAVGDTSHLLAELIDNATHFSQENTRVKVWVEHAEHGAIVEIEDSGIGMKREKRAWADGVMASPPEFDQLVHDGDAAEQLGLFTAAHLARAHDIRVGFTISTATGTRVSVHLPQALLVSVVDKRSHGRPLTRMRGELSVNGSINGAAAAALDGPPVDPRPSAVAARGNQETSSSVADKLTAIDPPSAGRTSLGPKRVPGANLPAGDLSSHRDADAVADPTRVLGFFLPHNNNARINGTD